MNTIVVVEVDVFGYDEARRILHNLSAKEVFHITKRNDIFYCLGNMGGIISMAFGFTYNNHEKISVIIGDGAFKMNLQSMLLLK